MSDPALKAELAEIRARLDLLLDKLGIFPDGPPRLTRKQIEHQADQAVLKFKKKSENRAIKHK